MRIGICDTTDKCIRLVLATSPTSPIEWTSHYFDEVGTDATPVSDDGAISNTTPVTIMEEPAEGHIHILRELVIFNPTGASIRAYMQLIHGAATRRGATWLIPAGEHVSLDEKNINQYFVDGLQWKGDWAAGAYDENDVVKNDGTVWIATADTSEEPTGTPTDWDILVVDGDPGADGTEIELQKSETHIQWRLVGAATWTDLVALADLKGDQGDDGDDGTEIELQKTADYIQWRYVGGSWTNLVALSEITGADGTDGEDGADGTEIELQKTETYIQWRYVGGSWVNLVALVDITGATGAAGEDGEDGAEIELQKSATHIQWRYVGAATWTDLVALADITGADGTDGEDGVGVPEGGTTGQVLAKNSDTDFDTEWVNAGSTADEKVKYNGDDTAAGYLSDKTVAGTGITLGEGTAGDADKLKITNSDTGSAAVTTHESTHDHSKLHDPATAGTGISITGQVVTNSEPTQWEADGASDIKPKSSKTVKYASISGTPTKAAGTDINTGTDDAKFVTSKAIADSDVLRKALAGQITAYTEKTTPVDGDQALIEDSEASGAKKRVTWANIKATLKAYFDTLYQSKYWQRNTTTLSPATAGDKLEVSSTSATGSRAIKGTAAGQVSTGVEGVATGTGSMGGKFTGGGWGILVVSDTIGAQIQGGTQGAKIYGTSSYGLEVYNTASDTATVYEYTTSALTDALSVNRREAHNTSGTAADGFGIYNDVELQTSTTIGVTATREVVKWTTAAHATATSIREWWLKSAGGAIARVFAVSGAGQPTFDLLGDGTFTGTAAYYLAVTSAGLVIEQAVPDESKWTRTGTKLTPKTANDIVEVTSNDATAPAIKGITSGTLMAGVYGDGGAAGYGVYGEGAVYGGYFKAKSSGNGVLAEATSGVAVAATNTSVTSAALTINKNTEATDALVPFESFALNSSGTAAAGLGIEHIYDIEDANGDRIEAGSVALKWSAATAGAVSSVWEWYHRRAGTLELCMSVLATGQLVLPLYTGSSFSGTAAKMLEIDSSGNVLQSAPSTQVRGFRSETDSFTLALAYAGQFHRVNKATDITVTIPKNSAVAIPVGTVYPIQQIGAGQLTITPVDGDVTLTGWGSGYKTYGQGSLVFLLQTSADVWTIIGGSA